MASRSYFTELPVELLGEIFSHCSLHSPDSPVVLRSVCRSFYRAIEITPQLWTNVRVSALDDEIAARKALLWFSKAGTCSLAVFVKMVGSGETMNSTCRLSATLAHHRARIATLDIHAQTETQVSAFLSSIYTAPTPSVHPPATPNSLCLAVQIECDYSVLESQSLLPSSTLPRLESLRLVTPTLPELTHVDFTHLNTLKITRPIRARPFPMRIILDILSSSTSLRDFHLETRLDFSNGQAMSPTSPIPQSPIDNQMELITLPELTSLSLRTNNNPALLSILVTPDLRILKLNALDGRRRGRAEETASALRRLLLRMEESFDNLATLSTANNSSSYGTSEEKGVQVLELAGVEIARPSQPGLRNELWEWCFRHMRSLRRLTARNMNTEHLVELLAQGMRRASAPSYMGLGHGPDGFAGSVEQLDNAVCPKLEYIAIPAPDASVAMKAFKLARPFVKVRAFGNGFGYWDSAITSSEDALKPRKVKFSYPVVAKTVMLGEGVSEAATKSDTTAADAGRPDVLNTLNSGNTAVQPAESTDADTAVVPTPSIPPCVLVGGFGFGSQFARTRSRPLGFPAPRLNDTRRRRFNGDELF
ncbi:hypothetical protein D9615_004239 [Tricholomella constricta]|uniref:F-box domain-containing protein n=1 Tax=Tricholomella constricta TaxID=117010 RepID=A0A8H5M650_9AGAR|nr:hypothetical protein D9615_004239 [Tricholomella constricta]